MSTARAPSRSPAIVATSRPGTPSPFRERSAEENLQLFRDMRAGKYADGEHVLRARST